VKLLLLASIAFLLPAQTRQSTNEAELRDAVQTAEKFSRDLRTELKRYHEHLLTALYRLGLGEHHPLFRTNIDGFSTDEIDLEALDEYKMGRVAYQLKSDGAKLEPDPFADWAEVQNLMDDFRVTMDHARHVVASADVMDVRHGVGSAGNLAPGTYKKLLNRWRAANITASEAYDQAKAIRAVRFEDGIMVAAEPNVLAIPGAGPYVRACAFKVCSSAK
jgi:hypothetical protein